MNKKLSRTILFAIIIVLLFLLSALFVITGDMATKQAFAEDKKVNFVCEDASALPESEFTIRIFISENSSVCGLRFSLAYDEELVTIVADKSKSLTSNGILYIIGNTINFSYGSLTPASDRFDCVELTFRVNQNVEAGIYGEWLKPTEKIDITDGNFNEIDYSFDYSELSVTIAMIGDIYQDGEINTKDSIYLLQVMAKMIDPDNATSYRANVYVEDNGEDGSIKLNSRDAILLLQYLAKMPVTLGEGSWSLKIAPTFTEEGTLVRKVATGISTVSIPTLNETDYTYTVLKEANCQTEGIAIYVYEKGGSSFEFKVDVPKTATHTAGEWSVKTEPTCIQNGTEEKLCVVCGKVLETRTIEKLSHEYSTAWTTDKAPTCTESGSKSHHCIRCGEKTDVTQIEALGHDYGSWKVTLNPTLSSTGMLTRICSRNTSHKETFTLPVLDKIKYSYLHVSDSTCSVSGQDIYTYEKDGMKFEFSVSLKKTEHTPGTAATCTTPQLCTVCGTVLQEPVDHQFSDVTFICSVCGISELVAYRSFDAITQICTYTQTGSTLTFFYDKAEGIELDFLYMNFTQSYKNCSNFVFRFGKNATIVLVKGGGNSYSNVSFTADDNTDKFILALDSITLRNEKVINSSASDFEIRFLGDEVNISSNSNSGTAISCKNVIIRNYANHVKISGGNGGRGNDCSSSLTSTTLATKGGNGGEALTASSSLVIEINQGELQFFGGSGGMGGTGYYASSVDIQDWMVGGAGGQGGLAVKATSITLKASDVAKVSFYGGNGGTGGKGGTSTGAGGKGGKGGVGGTGGYAISTSSLTITLTVNASVTMIGGNGGTGGEGGPHAKIMKHTCGDGGTGGTGGYAVFCKTMKTTLKNNAVIVVTGGSGGTGGTGGTDGSLSMTGGNGGTGGNGEMAIYAENGSISFYTENKAAVSHITLNIGLKGLGGAGGHPTSIWNTGKDGSKGSDGNSASQVANVTIYYGIQ